MERKYCAIVLAAVFLAMLLASGCTRNGTTGNQSTNVTINTSHGGGTTINQTANASDGEGATGNQSMNHPINATNGSGTTGNQNLNQTNQSANLTVYKPGDYDFRMRYGGIEREYLMHVPPSYSGAPSQVVIYFHGGGGSMGDSKQQGMYNYSDKYGFILLSPAGTNRWGTEGLRTWNAGRWDDSGCCGYALEKNVDDVGFTSIMIEETKKKMNVDAKRIYATGHSNGGAMAYRLACQLSDKIAAAAPASPAGLESACAPARPISVMQIHGTADPCVPYYGGKENSGCLPTGNDYPPAQEEIKFWRNTDGCAANGNISYQKGDASCTSYSCSQGTEVEFCTVTGMGHAWPSGNPTLANIVGEVSFDISFDQIWEFFQRNPMK
ncbi:Esterase PHB depolymerase [uncultured archaeon]|nr:Esterase PHB depolymerase [uncultured archaeon]